MQAMTYGGILSTGPLITVGMRSTFFGRPLGLLTDAPDLFRREPSFNILTLGWSHDSDKAAGDLARDIAGLARDLPLARVLVIANEASEMAAFARAGVEAVHSSLLVFCNEAIYTPAPPATGARFDAVYVAGLESYKRHELATGIDRLMLVYWPPTGPALAGIRALLPHAHLANHDRHGGTYVHAHPPQYIRLLAEARVGLCLSAREGPMRASIEYALCGLPVVTTDAPGGRIEMLPFPHARVVPDDPREIAAAVAELGDAATDPGVVRAAMLARLAGARQAFQTGVTAWLARTAGPDVAPPHPARYMSAGMWRARPLSAAHALP